MGLSSILFKAPIYRWWEQFSPPTILAEFQGACVSLDTPHFSSLLLLYFSSLSYLVSWACLFSVCLDSFKASVTKQIFVVEFYWKFGSSGRDYIYSSIVNSLKWRLSLIYKFFRYSHCWKFVDCFSLSLSPATLQLGLFCTPWMFS